MKHVALLCGAVVVTACVQTSEISTRSADLPGIPTTINCNPEPTLVYSKMGDLIDKVYPVLHPSCKARAASTAAIAKSNTNSGPDIEQPKRRFTSLFGPATYSFTSKLEADEDGTNGDPADVVVANDVPVKEVPGPAPDGTEPVEPSDNPSDDDPVSGDPSGGDPSGGDPSGETPTEEEPNEETPTEEEPTEEEPHEEEPQEEESEEPANEEEEEAEEPEGNGNEGLSKLDQLKKHAGLL